MTLLRFPIRRNNGTYKFKAFEITDNRGELKIYNIWVDRPHMDNEVILEKVKLIHISDLHFLSTKYKVLPDYFFEQLDKACGVIVCGDLTDAAKGISVDEQYSAYDECVKFLKEIISHRGIKIYILVGNHDVNRNNCGFSQNKFKMISQIIEKYNLNVAIDTCKSSSIEKFDYLKVIEINSCKNLSETCGDPAQFTPDDINLTSSHIKQLEFTDFPIVLSHHNIVPKCSSTETLEFFDAGMFRENMLETGRMVMYLHGHLHKVKDPLIIKRKNNATLICISSPKLFETPYDGEEDGINTSGFNIIDFFVFKNIPIGCKVRTVVFRENSKRINNNNSLFELVKEENTNLRLFNGGHSTIEKYGLIDEIDEQILGKLTYAEQYFSDIAFYIPDEMLYEKNISTKTKITNIEKIKMLRTSVLKLYWLGFIDMSVQDYNILDDISFNGEQIVGLFLNRGT